jgi:histidine ammonia-lyase
MVICENVKTCGILKTATAGKNKNDKMIIACDHAAEHEHTEKCANSMCLRCSPAASNCVEVLKPVEEALVAAVNTVIDAPHVEAAKTEPDVIEQQQGCPA